MSGAGRLALAVAGVLVVVLLLAGGWWWWTHRPRAAGGAPAGEEAAPVPELSLAVDLYFPTRGTTLAAENRELPAPDDPERQLLLLARTLLEGPESPSLVAPLPAGVEVRSVHLGDDGVAFVDLVSADGQEPPAGGSMEEMLRVYSLVDTLALNVASVRSVVLLWNGEQRLTFAGHVDTSRPLLPDTALVQRAAEGG